MRIGKNLVSHGAAAVGLLLLLLLLVLLQTDFLQQITRPREARITQVSDDTAHQVLSSDLVAGDRVDGIKDAAATPKSRLSCDLSSYRFDICNMEGDVRMHGKSATIYVVAASGDSYRPKNEMVRTHPYPRKWEEGTMQIVREVTIRWSSTDDAATPPRCTVMSDVPAVVFSTTGNHKKNYYHVMTDTIIPLYNKVRVYDGHVQLVATDYNGELISKYRQILSGLSIYPVLDFDADEAVQCFPSVHVGIEGTEGGLTINPVPSGKGYTMVDFRDFLRTVYSLNHPANHRSRRPRLVMVLRRHSRAITNEAEAMAAATEVGFEVVAAGPEMVRDMAKVAELVSSCDVMVGVHGAGLTNMVFLPQNATVLQIIPWGNMKEISFLEYGRPLPDMGLRHAEYEVTAEETTLKEVYPKDHAVFTDPNSIHEQGWVKVWEIFLNGQNITLDIGRFRGVMQDMYRSVTIT